MAFMTRSQALTGTPLTGLSGRTQSSPVARRGAAIVRAVQTEPSKKQVPDDVLSCKSRLPSCTCVG